MAFFECHFFSDVLGLSVSAHVLLPQKTSRQIGLVGETSRSGNFATLTLLHGLSDDHTIWQRRTSIERYAAEHNLAVIMPAVARSFYQDMASGPRYWTYLSEELPQILRGFFPLSNERSRNFVAGLSMGGYGALRLGLTFPERFAAVASFSGAIDVARRCRQAGRPDAFLSRAELEAIFGPKLAVDGTDADLFHLAKRLAASAAPRPRVYISCGTEDPLLAENRTFTRHLGDLRLEQSYHEAPGGHDWAFWDSQIQRVLAWLPLR